MNATAGINVSNQLQLLWVNATLVSSAAPNLFGYLYVNYPGDYSGFIVHDNASRRLDMNVDIGNVSNYGNNVWNDSKFINHLNENFLDSSPRGLATSVLGNAQINTSGKIGSCIKFDGANDALTANNLFNNYQNGTIIFWVRTDSTMDKSISATKALLYADDSAGTHVITLSLSYVVAGNGNLTFDWTNGTKRYSLTSNRNEWNKSVWYQVAATWEYGKNLTMYINGAFEKVNTTFSITNVTNNVQYAYFGMTRTSSYDFDGSIDEIQLYDRVLTGQEINAYYLNQNGTQTWTYGDMQYNYYFNYTSYDEKTKLPLTVNVTISNGTETRNYYNVQALNYWATNVTTGTNTMTVSATGYGTRTYYFSNGLTSSVNMTTFLLSSAYAITESIYVMTSMGIPILDALVTVSYPFSGGNYQTVAQVYTDTTGFAGIDLETTKQYRFTASATGYQSTTFDLTPSATSPVVYVKLLTIGEGSVTIVNYTTPFTTVTFDVTPHNFYQNNSFTVQFILSDSNSTIEYQGLNASWANGTVFCSQYTNSNPSGTTLSCPIPNQTGKFYIYPYFKKQGFSQYNVWGGGSYVYFLNYIKGLVRAAVQVRQALSDTAYFIVLIIIMIIVSAAASRFVPGMAVAWLAIGVMAMGIALNPGLTVEGISGWYILATMILTALALTMVRSYI